MKKLQLFILLLFVTATSFGQFEFIYTLNFEDTLTLKRLRIDTLANPNNLWKIGSPHKSVFTSAYSAPKVIVTDTVNPYPANDTSSFKIVHVAASGFTSPHTVILAGEYYVNSDTLSDYGTIEFSPDNGTTWNDLINNTIYSNYIWWQLPKPQLTGNSGGWQAFEVRIPQLGPVLNIHFGDTVLYRFTFISDSIQTNKDGLMFDDLRFEDWMEDVEEIQNDNLITIYPNPANEKLYIRQANTTNNSSIEVFDCNGRKVIANKSFNDENIITKNLQNGLYLLKYSVTKQYSIKRFVVQH